MNFNHLLKNPFSKRKLDTSAHLTALDLPNNHLLKQILVDANLNNALTWLRTSSSKQDHSDVWDYSRDWEENKTSLQHRVQSGQFKFQIVREVETDGQWREIRCAEDRLLIRAISQVLTPVFTDNISAECVHLVGRGGTQKAVEDVHTQLKAQPKAQVMKSDVKGYYASVDHQILLEQFCSLLPNETKLQRLLWLFLQRTVERGGNYRDIKKGLPLGASISPQLGALYLTPLDALFNQDGEHFYRRHKDDWVIFAKNRWDLRKIMKEVYNVLHALKVEVAPDKTYIGLASKGFDFLGKRILPIGVLPSASALSRLQDNTVWYEQGASKKRIELYWKRWLIWGFGCGLVIQGNAWAACSPNTNTNGMDCLCATPDTYVGSWIKASGAFLGPSNANASICSSSADTICGLLANDASLALPLDIGQTIWAKTSGGEYFKCTIAADRSITSVAHTPTAPPANPTPVRAPFSPLPFLPILPLIGLGVFTYIWRNKNKR